MYNVNFSKFFLGWPFFNMNNFWLKKYEKSVTEFRKGKTMERRFPKVFQHFNNYKECFALCSFIFTYQN